MGVYPQNPPIVQSDKTVLLRVLLAERGIDIADKLR
jgi:hypothetical protein